MRALAWLVLAACGPQLDRLVEQRHYREAICAASDGSAEDRDVVKRALAADAGVLVHVEMIRAEHLWPLLGSSTDDVMQRARFARVRVQSNQLPVDDIDIDVAFLHDREPASLPISWTSLASATAERLPDKRTRRTYNHPGTYLKAIGALFTFGLSLALIDERTVEVDAPDSAYRGTAPRAHALRHAMLEARSCAERPAFHGRATGVSCEWYVAIDPAPQRELSLEVTVRYAAAREQRHGSDRCRLAETSTIRLGPAADLDAKTSWLFGPRMRELSRLTIP
jgi:hypothetical protein